MKPKKKLRWYFYPCLLLLVILLLFGGFLGFLTAAEYRPEPVEPALTGGAGEIEEFSGQQVRILSFNTGYTSLGKDADFLMDGGTGSGQTDRETVNANMAGISEILKKSDADVYMLQEIDRDSARTFHINQLDAFSEVLPEDCWSYAPNFLCKFVPYPLPDPFGSIDSGVATYSRFAVQEASRISLPVPFSWPVRTANLKRCILSTRIPIADSDVQLVILNFHLEAYDSGEGKQAQTAQLLSILSEEYQKGNYVIAGGDFNQIFPQVSTDLKPSSQWIPGRLDPLPQDMQGWRFAYDDSAPTCRLLNQPYDPESPLTQYYVIDGFIVSPNLEISHVQTLDEGFQFSDHNPVVLDAVLLPSGR